MGDVLSVLVFAAIFAVILHEWRAQSRERAREDRRLRQLDRQRHAMRKELSR